MTAMAATVVPRWEYDLGGRLVRAILDDDRRRYDDELAAVAGDPYPVQADLIAVALSVAELCRWPWPVVHVRPSPAKRRAFSATLAGSAFTDIVDVELASVAVGRLYQRVYIDPLATSVDAESLATSLAVCGWTLWNQRALLHRDRFRRADAAYRAATTGLRLRRFAVLDVVRTAPPAA